MERKSGCIVPVGPIEYVASEKLRGTGCHVGWQIIETVFDASFFEYGAGRFRYVCHHDVSQERAEY